MIYSLIDLWNLSLTLALWNNENGPQKYNNFTHAHIVALRAVISLLLQDITRKYSLILARITEKYV